MQKIKRALALFLAISMLTGMLGTAAFAAEEEASVARVGEQYFDTLQAAIDAARDGDTVVLLKDTEETQYINITKSLTIMGGDAQKTIRSSATRMLRVTSGNVELSLENLNFVGKNVSGSRGIQVDSGSEIDNVTLNVKNCKVSGVTHYALCVQGDGSMNTNISVNVSDCELTGYCAVQAYTKATISVNNSTLMGYNQYVAGSNDYAAIVIAAEDVVASFTGCTIKSQTTETAVEYFASIRKKSNVKFTGCTFEIEGEYASNTLSVYEGAESSVTVDDIVIGDGTKITMGKDGLAEKPVAKVTAGGKEVHFYSLANALAAARDGDTVTMLADVTTTAELTVKSGVTLDGNGKKLTNSTGRVFSATGATVKNLTMEANGNGYAIYTNGNTTVENCTFEGTTGWQPIYVKDEGAPDVVVNGCTFNTSRSMIIRLNTTFTNNTLNGAKGVTIAGSADGAVVTGNTFNNARLDIYPIDNDKVTIRENKLMGSSYVELEKLTYTEPVDLSGNYWENYESSEKLNWGDEAENVVIKTWYADEAMTKLVLGPNAEVTVTLADATVRVGNTVTLTATITGAEGVDMTWTSGDETIVTVSEEGVATGVAAGTATITVDLGNDVTASCTVTVTARPVNTGNTGTGTGNYNPRPTPTPTPTPTPAPTSPVGEEEEVDLEDPDVPLAIRPFLFEDVKESDWFHADVKTLFDKGLIDGVKKTVFAPYVASTRAMVATLLYRMAGEPSVAELEVTFADVQETDWYYNAVIWAYANGIFVGYKDGSFRGGEVITREQLAAVLSRYAVANGAKRTVSSHLEDFEDAEKVSNWAVEDMKWAVSAGLIKGRGHKLAPQETANRAELATLLVRLGALMEHQDENGPVG